MTKNVFVSITIQIHRTPLCIDKFQGFRAFPASQNESTLATLNLMSEYTSVPQ
jgi:hypothetical protein